MMKTSLLAGVAVSAIVATSGAQAADLGARPVYKAPVVAPPAWSWTGFYVGANIGAARARSSVSDEAGDILGAPADANRTGVIGGLQAGYNWQISNVVLGIEGDVSFASLDRTIGTVPGTFGLDDTFKSRLSALGTVRGRIGWAFDRVLVYGTGGVAFASLKDEVVDPVTNIGFTASPKSGVTGWTAGGGVEFAITNNWTAKAEYLHVGLPDRTVTADVPGGYTFAFKDSLDIGRVGINYKF
jgi:outer membrane immunogenic protein